jgi:hypothetical protein
MNLGMALVTCVLPSYFQTKRVAGVKDSGGRIFLKATGVQSKQRLSRRI